MADIFDTILKEEETAVGGDIFDLVSDEPPEEVSPTGQAHEYRKRLSTQHREHWAVGAAKATAKEVGMHFVGAGETAMALASGALLYVPSKIWGLVNSVWGEEAARAAEEDMARLGYQALTTSGQEAVGKVSKLFEMGLLPAKKAGERMKELGYPTLGYWLETGGEFLTFGAAGAVVAGIKGARAPKAVRPQPDLKKPIPSKPRPPYPEGGIARMFAKERAMEKPKEILKTIEERKVEQLKRVKEIEKERIRGIVEKPREKIEIPEKPEPTKIFIEKEIEIPKKPKTIQERQFEMDKKYAPLLGKKVKAEGIEWEFVGTNDLGHPYFSKVVKGKTQKKQFTLSDYEKTWLDKQFKATAGETVAKQFPEHGLKYDGMYETGIHSFTPQKGPLQGKTFSVKDPTPAKIKAEIKDVESRFSGAMLTEKEIMDIIEGKRPETTIEKEIIRIQEGKEPGTTLESLGFQTSYEKTTQFFKSVAQNRTVKARAYQARMRNEALQEVPGNVLDKAAIRYIKEGKYKAYTDSMPEMGQIKPGELFKVDPTSGKLFASLKVGGKEKPAVRQSGFHAISEFQKEIAGYKDIGKTTYEWADPTRWMQEIDQGKFGGPAQQHILWPTRKTTLAKGMWKDTHVTTLEGIGEKFRINSKKRDSSLGDIVEHIKSEDIGKAPAEVLKDPKVAKYLKDYKEPVKHDIIRAGQETRKFADQLLEEQNMARRKRGQKEIDKREFYRPWIIETNLWSRLGLQRAKPKEVMDVPGMSEFIKPDKPFNARAEARMGLLAKYPKEKRMLRLMADYIDTAAKDIFDTNIIHHNKIHAAVLREKQPFAANAVDRWTAEVFAGTGHWFSRGVKRVFPPWMRKPVHVLRRNLTRAVFPLNWTWNMFIQTSSAGLTYLRYGNKSSMYGLKYFTDRKFNRAIKTNAYTHIIKSKWGGRVAYQDVQSSLMRSKKFQTTKIERAENFLNVFTNEIESGLTGHAIAAAYRDGKVRLGLEGRALWEYASEGGAKTQSMYNYGDLPGLLRAKEVGAVAPFQTFAFEVFNTIRELNIVGIRRVVGKTGIYETMSAKSAIGKATISRRLRAIARWTAAIMITNAVAEAAIGRKPWQGPSSFVPFLAYVLNGDMPRGPVPIQYKDDFMRGVKNVIEYGDWRQLRKWAIRYHVPAGVQLERTIQGIEAIANEGVVTDVRGRPILEIPREEYTAALLKGPWKTPTAIKKMREKKKKTLRTIKVIR